MKNDENVDLKNFEILSTLCYYILHHYHVIG